MCTNFQTSRPHSPREKCDERFQSWKLERKKNEEIKGRISSSSLTPVNKIHLPTAHVCTKFQSSRPHSCQEKCDEKFLCLKGQLNLEIVYWKFYSPTRACNSEVTDPIRPESELVWDFILSWLPASLMKTRSKMNELAWRHHFPIISPWEIFQMVKGS